MVVNRLHLQSVPSSTSYSNLDVKYILEIPRCECLIASSRQKTTGKVQLFLVFNNRERVYSRNGLKGTWDDVQSDEANHQIRQLLTEAIRDKRIPCYRVNNFRIS